MNRTWRVQTKTERRLYVETNDACYRLRPCSSECRASWAVRWIYSFVLSEVPGVVLYLCVQGKGTHLYITPIRNPASPAYKITAVAREPKICRLKSGDRHCKCKVVLWLAFQKLPIYSIPLKSKAGIFGAMSAAQHRAWRATPTSI